MSPYTKRFIYLYRTKTKAMNKNSVRFEINNSKVIAHGIPEL